VASLLEVGTGFHPELTGRENIFLNGSILGMTREEVRRKFDEIVSFAEVETFLDTPVKRYSSGMYVRLAFAVAAHLEPEILVVDEVLAVGDVEFQKKCLGKMSEVATGGRTVLFVSHNMAAVQTLCSRAILLSRTILHDGPTDEVIATYLNQRPAGKQEALRIEDGLILKDVAVEPATVRSGDPVRIQFTFEATRPGKLRECAILLHSLKGIHVALVDPRDSGALPLSFKEGQFTIITRISSLPVVEGSYSLGLYVVSDMYSGNLFDIRDFDVSAPASSRDFVSYPADYRGLVELQASSSVTW
jgi:lipopolysaccharide transport system ATP-binding protein